jgi:tRNA U38,U39,U40 pseudouridine synthase TruA
MVAGLLEVGLDRMDASGLRAALAGREPALNGAAAPAQGLCLRRVRPRTTADGDDKEDEE